MQAEWLVLFMATQGERQARHFDDWRLVILYSAQMSTSIQNTPWSHSHKNSNKVCFLFYWKWTLVTEVGSISVASCFRSNMCKYWNPAQLYIQLPKLKREWFMQSGWVKTAWCVFMWIWYAYNKKPIVENSAVTHNIRKMYKQGYIYIYTCCRLRSE